MATFPLGLGCHLVAVCHTALPMVRACNLHVLCALPALPPLPAPQSTASLAHPSGVYTALLGGVKRAIRREFWGLTDLTVFPITETSPPTCTGDISISCFTLNPPTALGLKKKFWGPLCFQAKSVNLV